VKIAIVDDEPPARKTIRLLARRDPEITIVAECRNGEEALDAVREQKPDILFLDIQMPRLDGFDVLELLGEDAPPAIVFVTAYDQYAIRAFEVHAVDYLLKPFTDERFDKALARAKDLVRRSDGGVTREKLSRLTAAHRAFTQRFMVRTAGRIVFLKAEEVDWIEAADYYARLHTGANSYLIRESMNDLEATLDPASFVRIHRSTIVNLDRVREMRPLFRGELVVVLSDGTQLRMSRSRRDELESRFRRPR
jgi:two-component system LytT family response regulator